MSGPIHNKVKQHLAAAEGGYYRLVLLVGEGGSSKTAVLKSIAEEFGVTVIKACYNAAGQQAEYIRQAGFSPIQHEEMVLTYIDKNGSIKRADVADLCRITLTQGTRLLQRLVKAQEIRSVGAGKGTRYERLL